MPAVTETSALAGARSHARAVCDRDEVTSGRCDDTLLVLSELLSNACRHGTPPVIYDVRADRGDILVTVHDDDPAAPPLRTAGPSADAENGRGLLIVDALAKRWGCDSTRTGKTMWARL